MHVRTRVSSQGSDLCQDPCQTRRAQRAAHLSTRQINSLMGIKLRGTKFHKILQL